jgi:hypothetical protein
MYSNLPISVPAEKGICRGKYEKSRRKREARMVEMAGKEFDDLKSRIWNWH